VAAFGSLSYFKAVNAPAGSTDRCVTCPVAENCRFEAKKCYLPTLGTWPTDVVCLEQTQEALMAALQDGPYGRCVYRCDNNVCDHMSMILEFDNEVTATFSLTAQTGPCHRQIRIMCQDGEILADDSKREILIRRHVSSPADTFEERTIHVRTNASGHGGGDAGIMEGFTASLSAGAQSRSTISASVESHLMACALEQSRITGKVIALEDFRKELK
jgi:predicted dehydrogenase